MVFLWFNRLFVLLVVILCILLVYDNTHILNKMRILS